MCDTLIAPLLPVVMTRMLHRGGSILQSPCRYDEDFPADETGIRANNHYRHAVSGIGLTNSAAGLGDRDIDALSWAKLNPYFKPAEEFQGGKDWQGLGSWGWTANDVNGGKMSWLHAIDRYGYTLNSHRLAYYTLGFVLHLLQDLGCPEHVHDDPHGASGYNGFKMWVYKEWQNLKPNRTQLKPKRFREQQREKIDHFFINLSKLAYSVNRFDGGILKITLPDGKPPASNLTKMFKIGTSLPDEAEGLGAYSFAYVWEMENYSGDYIKAIPPRFRLVTMTLKPDWAKGLNEGEWWPTSMEIPSRLKRKYGDLTNDRSGPNESTCYVELSGDVPGDIGFDPVEIMKSPTRNFYPNAFLPTPLPEVADQCQGWAIETIGRSSGNEDPLYKKRTHLYDLIGRTILPYVVEHTAELMQYYHEIVNHPPFVTQVRVVQEGEARYDVLLEEREETKPGTDTITWIKPETGGQSALRSLLRSRPSAETNRAPSLSMTRLFLDDMPKSSSSKTRFVWWTSEVPTERGSTDSESPNTGFSRGTKSPSARQT